MTALWGFVTLVWLILIAAEILSFTRAACTVLLIGYIYLGIGIINTGGRKTQRQ